MIAGSRVGGGTEIVTSGEHRFLTDRGWRHVHPADPACPALAVGDPALEAEVFASGTAPEFPDAGYREALHAYD